MLAFDVHTGATLDRVRGASQIWFGPAGVPALGLTTRGLATLDFETLATLKRAERPGELLVDAAVSPTEFLVSSADASVSGVVASNLSCYTQDLRLLWNRRDESGTLTTRVAWDPSTESWLEVSSDPERVRQTQLIRLDRAGTELGRVRLAAEGDCRFILEGLALITDTCEVLDTRLGQRIVALC